MVQKNLILVDQSKENLLVAVAELRYMAADVGSNAPMYVGLSEALELLAEEWWPTSTQSPDEHSTSAAA